MEKSVVNDLILSNGHKVEIQTSTRQEKQGEKSTFTSINTGSFRIRIVQRISLDDAMPHSAQIAFSTTSETSDLTAIKILALSLDEAIRIAEQMNKKVLVEHSNDCD